MRIRLLPLLLAGLLSCTGTPLRTEMEFRIEAPSPTRALNPDETLLSDLNVFIFNSSGLLEEHRFIDSRNLERSGGDLVVRTSLIRENAYSVYLCANLGYDPPVRSLDELLAFRYHLAFPDEYAKGIPMTGRIRDLRPAETDGSVRVPLERMMAKVSVSMDRNALDSGVRVYVRRIRVGACPSSALLFGPSRAENGEQLFHTGFSRDYKDADGLNREEKDGVSREVGLYLLENLQGTHRSDLCSYVELECEYYSDRYYSGPDQYLVYRFHLGETPQDYDVERNCHYHFTVRPAGDGLSGDGWRVDRSKLGIISPDVRFDLHPAAYNESDTETPFHLWCEVSPEDTPMEIEPIAYDEDNAVSDVYDYQIDADGHGLTLQPKKGGTALIYFKAGPPVSRDTLALVVFNLHE